jgi:DNA-binding XRE family transcriptional regulator
MSERYAILLDKELRPVVTRNWLWVFSPGRAAEVAQELGYVPSPPMRHVEVWQLTTSLGVDFAAFAPDHLLPSTLIYPNAAYRHQRWKPSRWAFVEHPEFSVDADPNIIALMKAPSSQFTARPRETAPDEYAPSGELLRAQRERAGLTQAALAEKAGLDIRVVERLEGEHRKPHSETIRRLAKALDIPYAKLLGWEFDKLGE